MNQYHCNKCGIGFNTEEELWSPFAHFFRHSNFSQKVLEINYES